MPEQKENEWATIGRIVAPFGLRGEVKVRLLTDIPDRFAQLEYVYLSPNYVLYTIEGTRPYKGEMLLLKLAGIDDATSAEVLRNCDICIPLDQLAPLPPDSYYQHDLLGLHVTTLSGREVGVIVDIIVTGSNDVYVVKPETNKQILIPAIKDVVKRVDLENGVMYIEPMSGLLDDSEHIESSQHTQKEEE